ncbi:MAG: hypothetical protein NTW86_26990 [Candidatus Sumerlaeota bacterium]|nr:hypothetical protein [Candidatus Sumerlaeota bacterium]
MRKDGSAYRRGPYPTYTFKRGGKTRGKQLHGPAEAALYRQQIEAFCRYQELSAQLVQVSHRLADLEIAGAPMAEKPPRTDRGGAQGGDGADPRAGGCAPIPHLRSRASGW